MHFPSFHHYFHTNTNPYPYLFRWAFNAVRVWRNSFRITQWSNRSLFRSHNHSITVWRVQVSVTFVFADARARVQWCRGTGRGRRRPPRFIHEKVTSTPARFPRNLYPGSSGFGADLDFEIVTLLTSNRWLNTCRHEWSFVTFYFRLSQSFDSLILLLHRGILNSNIASYEVFNSL